jgi:hypothetical protein
VNQRNDLSRREMPSPNPTTPAAANDVVTARDVAADVSRWQSGPRAPKPTATDSRPRLQRSRIAGAGVVFMQP